MWKQMSPLAHPKGKTPSRSCNLRKGVLFSAHGQALLRTTSQSASQTAPLVGELSNGVRLRGCTKTGLPIAVRRLCHQRPSPLSLVASSSPRPGCGSQRLLRCRSHPAGRCPNSSSLFPPLAAVVAVAPKGEPLACRSAFVWTSEAQYLGNSSAPLSRPATA